MPRNAIIVLVGVLVAMGLSVTGAARAMTLFPSQSDILLQPGAAITKYLSIINDDPEAIAIQVRTSLFHDPHGNGHPVFYDQVAAGLPNPINWVTTPIKPVVIQSGEMGILPITVSIPVDVPAGGYYAAVFAHTIPDRKKTTAIAEVGSLFFITVAGSTTPQVQVSDLRFHSNQDAIYPGTVSVKLDNSGTVHASPIGTLQIKNIFGHITTIPFNPEQLRLLPNTSRMFSMNWGKTLPHTWWTRQWQILQQEWQAGLVGPQTITFRLQSNDEPRAAAEATITVWVWPWRSILVVGIILLTLIVLVMNRRQRRYRHVVAK